MIGWSRILAGRFSDPLVGRDLLAGSLLGTLVILVSRFEPLLSGWLSSGNFSPTRITLGTLNSPREALAE